MGVAADITRRLLHEAEVRLGYTVVDRDDFGRLAERNVELEALAQEAGELAWHSLDYFSGKPQDMRPEKRNRLAQRSRIALMEDPLAGAEAELLANFAFGRGITVPQAADEKVQKEIDDAWTDPLNDEKLTSFEAQRHRSHELLTQANLYPVAYISNGYVRLGFLDADTVTHIVTDPEDEERPLWYVTRKRRVEWDFENDRVKTTDEMRDPQRPKVTYYPHWRHVEDARAEYEADGEKLKEPPAGKLGKGLATHIRINRIGRTQFGTPPWARTLRFFQALNDVTEAHVVQAQAASTLIAKRVLKGTPEGITKSANAVLSQTGEIGAARFGMTPDASTQAPMHGYGSQPAPPPGSMWLESEADKLESLSLNSGASQTAQTAQIVRAPIAAQSGFGQHYLGDAGNANLATATSLELPTLMVVQAWQQTMKDMIDWFVTLVVQEAVRAGRLGGYSNVLTEEQACELGVPARVAAKPLSELRLFEAADKAEAERRTEKSLDFTVTMPYPGRRNLPDVVSLVTQIAAGFDPQGVNVPLRRYLLTFLATHGMQLEDPAGFVDDVMPEDMIAQIMPGMDAATGEPYVDPRSKDYVPPEPQQGGGGGAGDQPGGRRPPNRDMGSKGGASREALAELIAGTGGLFDDVMDPVLSGNGNGSHDAA
jgi:hypothetical protein